MHRRSAPFAILIAAASAEHPAQVVRVLAPVDSPDNVSAKAVEGNAPEPLVVAYPIRQTDGDAAAAVLRSLFLNDNH